jgi:hypothetical protein
MGLRTIKISKGTLWTLYILIIFTTELFSFKLLGGSMRIYYLLNFFILLKFTPMFRKLFNNQITQKLIIFCIVLIAVNLFSINIIGSISASLSLMLNVIGAFVAFFILTTEKVSFEKFINSLEIALLINLLFGLFTLVLYQTTGIELGFTEVAKIQLSQFQIAGFRTEANTHGKLACFVVAYCIPFVINQQADKSKKWLFALAVITLVISPTRAATYALIVAIMVLVLGYLGNKKLDFLIKRFFIFIFIVLLVYSLFVFKIIDIGGYSLEKLNNFFVFSYAELNQDGSGGFRLESILEGLRLWSQNAETIFFGVGFGQTYSYLQLDQIYTRAGGTELITLLSGAGLITVLLWCNVVFSAIKQNIYNIKLFEERNNLKYKLLSESMLTVLVYIFTIGFTSGTMYVPECWLTFGLAAYLSVIAKNTKKEI